MTRISLIALFAALCQPAAAQSLGLSMEDGAPAIESSGSSSTTVDAIGDSVSATVGGSGALDVHTNSGTVEADGSLNAGINGETIELRSAPIAIGGADGNLIPAFSLDPDGNGLIDAAEGDAARRFSAERGNCDGVIVSTSSPDQIIAIERAQAISLMLVCADPDGLEPEKRAAIAANPALMNRLADAGFGLGDVAGIVLDGEGRGTLYLAAS